MGTASLPASLTTDEYLYFLARAFAGMLDVLERAGRGGDQHETAPAGGQQPLRDRVPLRRDVRLLDRARGRRPPGEPEPSRRVQRYGQLGRSARRRVADLQRQLLDDLVGADLQGAPKNTPAPDYEGPEQPLTCAGVLLHVLEELAQHHGQVQLSRDVLLDRAAR